MSIYSDINSLRPTLQPLLLDIQSIYQSLFNLFNTKEGERLFLPEFFFGLEDELFEIMDDLGALSVFRTVIEAISRWESRVIVDTSRTTVTPFPDENRYELELYFSIRGLENQQFTFFGSFTN